MDDFLSVLNREIKKLKGSEIENLNYDTVLNTVGIDSLDLTELVFQVETDFGVTISYENAGEARRPGIYTVGDLKKLLDDAVLKEATVATEASDGEALSLNEATKR